MRSRVIRSMEFFNASKEIERKRRRLPHWQQGQVAVFVTFRLSDSLPRHIMEPWLLARKQFMAIHPLPWDELAESLYHREFSISMQQHLDAGHGCCALRSPEIAKTVADRLHYFDGQCYRLLSYVVMPNHVHVLLTLEAGESLSAILRGWKGVSSRLIHKAGLSALNPFWQREYFDRLIRSPEHLTKVSGYIRENPVTARLRKSEFVYWER